MRLDATVSEEKNVMGKEEVFKTLNNTTQLIIQQFKDGNICNNIRFT